MTAVSAVIFDCDGVLVDSETIAVRMWVEMAGELGLELPWSRAMHQFKGGAMATNVAWLESQLGRHVPDDFVETFRARLGIRFEQELEPIAGVRAVLDGLEVPYCVASNGPREKMDVTLSVTGLMPYFESRIVSAYEVGSFKPDPGLFLRAAELLEVAPERCAVVEDSLTGIRAGVAAGMRVFAYSEAEEFEAHRAAGAVPFAEMGQLSSLLFR